MESLFCEPKVFECRMKIDVYCTLDFRVVLQLLLPVPSNVPLTKSLNGIKLTTYMNIRSLFLFKRFMFFKPANGTNEPFSE